MTEKARSEKIKTLLEKMDGATKLYRIEMREYQLELLITNIDCAIAKQYPASKKISLCLDFQDLDQETCKRLTDNYEKNGWKVSFSSDPRNDPYIILEK